MYMEKGDFNWFCNIFYMNPRHASMIRNAAINEYKPVHGTKRKKQTEKSLDKLVSYISKFNSAFFLSKIIDNLR